MPSDDELVRAIVGPTGSEEQRADADRITRDLLLPRLRLTTGNDLGELRRELQSLATTYEIFNKDVYADRFLRLAVFEEVGDLGARARPLAIARVKHALWPSEPMPEAWEHAARIDPTTVTSTAAVLHYRMLELEGRYGGRLPAVFSHPEVELGSPDYGQHRTVVLARIAIHVALTGDYSLTTGAMYDELMRRGVKTTRAPEEQPY